MNQKTAKRIKKISQMRETDPKRQRKFYQNAKAKFKKSSVIIKTGLNKLIDIELKKAA